MKIDLHIHTSTGSDGALPLAEVFREAKKRNIGFISITDHDNIEHQGQAIAAAAADKIRYITGVELNITFSYFNKSVSLDFLGYGYDYRNTAFLQKLQVIREHREKRARQIMANLNTEFTKENRPLFTDADLLEMQAGVDGALGRPHIADYLIKKLVVASRQEAFDKYLVKCDVPKYPLYLAEASALVRGAGGRLVLAHPNDPNGTSLATITQDLDEQTRIIREQMLAYIDGVECWHTRHDAATTAHYVAFCKQNNLLMTGGSDCHQKPIIMGAVNVPAWVARQFY
ncbi:MAG: PHP domain-containing protein [Dehalococcoidales bacterium]|jgi:predicted metal-dependent phosphoesterase TrpH